MPTTSKKIRATLSKKRTSKSLNIYRYHVAVYKPKVTTTYLASNVSTDEAANITIGLFGAAAYDVAIFTRNQIAMYTGNINPTWRFWDSVASIINPPNNA